jgi:hypothetical protein
MGTIMNRTRRRIATLAMLVISAGLPAIALGAVPAGASTIQVADEAGIRDAFVTEANDIIELTADIVLDDCGGEQLLWTSGTDLTINGNGHTLSVSPTCSNPGQTPHRVIHYRPNAAANRLLTVHNLTVTGGTAQSTAAQGLGGGILVDNLDLSFTASLVISGGSVIGSTTGTGNFASNGGGGAFVVDGNLTVDHSTIAGNETSGNGGGIGALVSNQTITVTSSTIVDNEAGFAGGGIAGTNVTVTNSTITENESGSTAGREGGGLHSLAGTTTVKFSTIVDNTAPGNGGANVELTTPVSATFFGTVVAFPHSSTAGTAVNCEGALTSSGYNFSDVDTCGFGAGTGDIEAGGDPDLTALANNGGLTKTMRPLQASQLNKQVPANDCINALAVDEDQRGVVRPSGTFCEIGAVERKTPSQPTSVSGTPNNGAMSMAFAAPTDAGESSISTYTVTCTPISGPVRSATSIASPIIVSSMVNGMQYACVVRANNADGSGAGATVIVIPRTVPAAPTNVVATPGNGQMVVAFGTPNDGGSPITSYTVTESPQGVVTSGDFSPITVTGLTNGVAHTFTVKATNVAGTGPESAASAPKTTVFQPDVMARKSNVATFTDVNAYGVANTTSTTVKLGKSFTFVIRLFNDGTATDAINLKATFAGNNKLSYSFNDGTAFGSRIGTTGRNYPLAPGAFKQITVTVKANAGTPLNANRTATLTSRSLSQTNKLDQVKVKVTRN